MAGSYSAPSRVFAPGRSRPLRATPHGWLRTLRSHLVIGSHCSQSGYARYSGSSNIPKPRVYALT